MPLLFGISAGCHWNFKKLDACHFITFSIHSPSTVPTSLFLCVEAAAAVRLGEVVVGGYKRAAGWRQRGRYRKRSRRRGWSSTAASNSVLTPSRSDRTLAAPIRDERSWKPLSHARARASSVAWRPWRGRHRPPRHCACRRRSHPAAAACSAIACPSSRRLRVRRSRGEEDEDDNVTQPSPSPPPPQGPRRTHPQPELRVQVATQARAAAAA